MKKCIEINFLAKTVGLLIIVFASMANSAPFALGPIEDTSEVEGQGCGVFPAIEARGRGRVWVFISWLPEGKNFSIINLNGKDYKLPLVKRIDLKSSRRYEFAKSKTKLTVVTRDWPQSKSIEPGYMRIKAHVKLTRGGAMQTLDMVGGCVS